MLKSSTLLLVCFVLCFCTCQFPSFSLDQAKSLCFSQFSDSTLAFKEVDGRKTTRCYVMLRGLLTGERASIDMDLFLNEDGNTVIVEAVKETVKIPYKTIIKTRKFTFENGFYTQPENSVLNKFISQNEALAEEKRTKGYSELRTLNKLGITKLELQELKTTVPPKKKTSLGKKISNLCCKGKKKCTEKC
ncbi:glutamate tRS [Acrasis kona]|uniref:Glutamate tRS n=1 Tax=Acrasis kona TaxID=1008807 RepID=A0AAW2YLY5_9EUKA